MDRLFVRSLLIPPLTPQTEWRRTFCFVAAFLLAGCASPYAKVSHRQPHLTGPPGSGSLASAETSLAKALGEKHAHPLDALADCLQGLTVASQELQRNSTNPIAIRDYNFGVSRIFQIVHDANLDPW